MSYRPSFIRPILPDPDAVSRDAIGEATGYKVSTRNLNIRLLANRQLVENVGSSEVRMSEVLS